MAKSNIIQRDFNYNGTHSGDKEILRHRIVKYVWYVTIIAILTVIVLACIWQWKTRVYSGYEVTSLKEQIWVSSTTSVEFEGNVLTYSKDGMKCVDQNGNVIWNQTYEMQNPMISICEDKVAIGDYNGRSIYVCSTEKILGTIATNLPIRGLSVSQDGIVAAILEDAGVTWIHVLTVDGRVPVTAKTQMKNSGYPIQVDFSPNSEMLAVSYLFIDNGKITTRIAFYNFGEVGQNYQDKLVGAYEYQDLIVPEIKFLNNQACVAIGDSRVMFYEGAQIPKSISEIINTEEIIQVFESNSYLGLVYLNDDLEQRYRMELYDSKGSLLQEVTYNFDCKNFLVSNNWLIIYNEEECRMLTLDGKMKLNTQFMDVVHLILPTPYDYKYVFMTSDALQKIELK